MYLIGLVDSREYGRRERRERTMAIAQIPQQVASAAKDAAQDFRERAASLKVNQPHWSRSVAVSVLITGVVLLIRGKRKAGLATAVAGAAIALLEEPQEVKAAWKKIPGYIDNGKRFLVRLEGFIEEFSNQGDRLRGLLDKAQR
jgi:hypothetical protein